MMAVLGLLYLLGLAFAVYLYFDDLQVKKETQGLSSGSWYGAFFQSLFWPVHFLVFIFMIWLKGFRAVLE
ncbi:MAG: hypothetical protein KC422_16060 [Trueperaceae bacterium]|nr:hypothetical protein [Trueperaceae bacterium]